MSNQTRREISDNISSLFQILLHHRKIDPPQAFHDEILRKAHETFRLLNSKITSQHVLCPGDSPKARSAIALEIVLRKGLKGQDGSDYHGDMVPLEILAKEVGCKEKEIDNLAHVAREILKEKKATKTFSGSAAGKGSARIQKLLGTNMNSSSKVKRRKKSNGKPSATLKEHMKVAKATRAENKRTLLSSQTNRTGAGMRARNVRERVCKKSLVSNDARIQVEKQQTLEKISPVRPIHLHGLSMKLQSKLHDPNASEKAATTMFLQLFRFKTSDAEAKTHQRKICAREDIEKDLGLYEACCFFIASKEMEQGRLGLKDIDLKKLQNKDNRARQITLAIGNGSDDEGNGDLMIEDVARVLRETPSELTKIIKDTIPIVARMRSARKEEMRRIKHDAIASTIKMKRNRPDEIVHKSLQPEQQIRRDYIHNFVHASSTDYEKQERKADELFMHNTPPPKNRKSLYQNQEAFDNFFLPLFEEIKKPGEKKEDVINRHFSEIIKRFLI